MSWPEAFATSMLSISSAISLGFICGWRPFQRGDKR